MTATRTEASVDLGTRSAATTRLVDGAIDLTRLFAAFKAAQGTSARHLLHVVRQYGPMRQSALAEHLHTDPSTVSRHVAELVGDGLVERQPDPEDGRANLLALTADGLDVVVTMRDARDTRVAAALDGWTTEQIDALGEGLERLTTSMGPMTTTTEGRP